MNSQTQKQHPSSGAAQAAGRGQGQQDLFEATGQQPKGTPTRKLPTAPDADEQEERSDLADIGEAEEQEGVVEGVNEGSAQQDPPATVPQDQRRERRHNL